MFSRLFSGTSGNSAKTKQQAPDLNLAIQQLREAIIQLEKREIFLQKKIDLCLEKAKQKSKAKDKKGAMFELKKKKQLENQLQSIYGKKSNLETQIMTLEDAHLNKETLKAMRSSANAMKGAIEEADLDKAGELMDDINEAIEQVQEINEVISQPIGSIIDEDELQKDLAELEEMEADELLNDMPNSNIKKNSLKQKQKEEEEEEEEKEEDNDLPEVPKGKITIKNRNEDAELAELEQMMS